MNHIPHILIVDDDGIFSRSTEYILSSRGYCVTTSNSGREAIQLITGGLEPDIILLDINMPDMDGFETFKNIHKFKNIPIIFITGNEGNTTELKGLTLGAVDYIAKPFVVDILIARINNHINISRQNMMVTQAVNSIEHNNSSISIGETDTLTVTLDQEKLDHMKSTLTESEYRIGKRIALGYTNKEIADELNYSYGYVKKVAYRIFDKLNIKKRTELRNFFTK